MCHLLIRSFIVSVFAAAAINGFAQDSLVIRNARIVTGNGPAIERGVVVVVGDSVKAVGADAEVPAGAQVIDGAGLTVYPGLIDAYCLAGVAPAPTAPATAPQAQQAGGQRGGGQRRGGGQGGGITPPPAAPLSWRKASDGFNEKSSALAVLRNYGYTAALFGVRGVLTPGSDMLMALTPGEKLSVLNDRAAINLNTLQRGNAYPSTLMGAFAFLRQSIWDGIDSRNHPPAKPEPRLDVLADAAAGKLPVYYAAQAENDIRRALKLAREFNLRLIILGGKDAEKVLPLIVAQKAAVVLTDDWSPAAALSKAGVPFALSSNNLEMSISEAEALHEKALGLVEKGLSADVVLAALTRTPAELIGASDRLGTIAAGKLANLVVADGDLFKKETKVKFVIVQGKRVDSAVVKADTVKPARLASDGMPYVNVTADDADGDGGGR